VELPLLLLPGLEDISGAAASLLVCRCGGVSLPLLDAAMLLL
jgi:hypothetical protein